MSVSIKRAWKRLGVRENYITGKKGRRVSTETRDRIRKRLFQHEVSAETRKKISKICTGKKRSLEIRAKISRYTKGENNPFYGKTHSPQSIIKMILAHTGHRLSAKTRRRMKTSQQIRRKRERGIL
jgi:hypothetical protein